MKVVEIFTSIEGEGKRVGMPCTFIRLFGCNLRCKYCDTPYGWSHEYEDQTTEMSVSEIVDRVVELGIPQVTITGGEPLLQKDILGLLSELGKRRFWVNVESNGSLPTKCSTFPTIFYTMDYKTDASGMSSRMDMEVLKSLTCKDVLKFVVGSLEDCRQAQQVIQILQPEAAIYFSPVFGQIEPKEIVEFLLKEKLYQCHVQVQLHKIIWDPEKRGV